MINRCRIPGRMVWLATLVFTIGGILILSLILFEVLDIDGSDFPTPEKNGPQGISLAESTHDIRRVLDQVYASPGATALSSLSDPLRSPQDFLRCCRAAPSSLSTSASSEQRYHLLLPRASLPDSRVA